MSRRARPRRPAPPHTTSVLVSTVQVSHGGVSPRFPVSYAPANSPPIVNLRETCVRRTAPRLRAMPLLVPPPPAQHGPRRQATARPHRAGHRRSRSPRSRPGRRFGPAATATPAPAASPSRSRAARAARCCTSAARARAFCAGPRSVMTTGCRCSSASRAARPDCGEPARTAAGLRRERSFLVCDAI